MKELEEEIRDSEQNEQAIMISTMKRRYERKRSASLIWNLSPNARAYQNEQAKDSKQHISNADVLEMLSKMEQNMKERDSQLKAQLKEGLVF